MFRTLRLAAVLALGMQAAAAQSDVASLPADAAPTPGAVLAPLAPRTLPSSLAPAQRERLRLAFLAAREGRWVDAQAAAAGQPLAAKVLRWHELVRAGAGFEAIAEFLERNPEWPLRETLMRRAEDATAPVTDDARVLDWFGARTPVSSQGALRLADAHRRTGDLDRSLAIARAVWRDMALAERVEKDLLQRYGSALTREDHAARVDRLIWERDYAEARRLLRLLDPDARLLADARIRLGRDTADAADVVARLPAGLGRDPGLLFERARYNRRNDHDELALAIHLGADMPLVRPEIWWRERQPIARRLLREGRAAEALSLVAATRGLGPAHGQAHTDALFLEGWIALRRTGDPARARDRFARLHEAARMPVTQARGAYWLGRAHEALGEPQVALGWYRQAATLDATFYGQMARLRLPEPERKAAPEGPPAPTAEERARIERSELARAAILLADVGEDQLVKHFVRRLIDIARTPGEHRAAAQVAVGLGRPDLAVSAAKRAAQRAGILLPDEGWPTIQTPPGNAPERALVLATIRQESSFEADAVSSAGARGLMQLMPTTARAVADQLGFGHRHSVQRLTAEPLYNMALGQAYLAGLLNDYNGSLVVALAAYNAGPGRVAQWIREHGDPRADDVDPIDWIEMIAFEETRNYVQRVAENLAVYRRKLGQRDWIAALERDFARAGR